MRIIKWQKKTFMWYPIPTGVGRPKKKALDVLEVFMIPREQRSSVLVSRHRESMSRL